MQTKIVHIVERMAPGGIETLALDLVRDDPQSHIVSLSGTTDELVQAWPLLATLGPRLTAMNRRGASPAMVLRLARRLRTLGAGTVFVHHIGPLIYGGAAARLAGVERLVHVEHDVWHYTTPRHRMLTTFAEHVLRPVHVAVSDNAARTLRELLPAARIVVIPNGIDIERFRPGCKTEARRALGLPQGVRLVGTAGRLVPVKGHEILVRAMTGLAGNIHVAIAGSGPEREALQALAAELGVTARLHLIGHIDGVERLLPALDVFCLPSHAEGFPRSVIEAQASGIPVVATDVGALAEAVCPTTGRLVTPADPAALARALTITLAAHPAASPRSYIESRYTWARTAAEYARLAEVAHAA